MSLLSALPVIALVLVQLAVWIYALVMRHIALRLRNLKRIDAVGNFAGRVQLSGIVALTAGGLCVAAISDPGNARVLSIPVSISALGLLIGGGVQLWAASVVRAAGRGGPQEAGGLASTLSAAAFLILIAPLSIGLLLSYFVLLVPIGVAIAMYAAGRRRLDQGAVLWSLAFGTEPGRSIEHELTELAPSLSRAQRGRTIRLAQLISNGMTLDAALAKVPGVVPHAAALEIQVGEQNGRLEAALKQSAIRHAGKPGLATLGVGSVSTVLLYLLVVPFVTVLIVFGLMKWIVPKYKAIFEGFSTDLPEVTKNLIEVSDVLGNSTLGSLIVICGILALGCLTYFSCRGWGEMKLTLIGRPFRRLDVPGILRNLAATYAADRPLESALALLAQNHRRRSVARALKAADARCRGGACPWQSLVQVGLLTRSEGELLTSAARAGNLWWALQHLADGIERRQAYRARVGMEFVQPLIVFAIGAMVAWVSLAMYMPLVKLINDLS